MSWCIPLDPKIPTSPRTASLSPAKHATALSTGTTCARTTFDTIKYTPKHMPIRPHMHAPPPVRSLIKRCGTALCQRGAEGRDCGLSRVCGPVQGRGRLRLHRADPSARAAAGRAVRAVTGRRAWSPEMRTGTSTASCDALWAQGVQMRVKESRARGAAAVRKAAGSRFETCCGVRE